MKFRQHLIVPALALSCAALISAFSDNGETLEPAPETSERPANFTVMNGDAILNDTTTEEVLAAFKEIMTNQDREPYKDVDTITATVGNTDFLLSIDLQEDTVAAILDAHSDELAGSSTYGTDVYAYDNTISVHTDACYETTECREESVAAMDGYFDAFADSDDLGTMNIYRKSGPSLNYKLTKHSAPGNAENYSAYFADALAVRHELEQLDLGTVQISQDYPYAEQDANNRAPLNVQVTTFEKGPDGFTCTDNSTRAITIIDNALSPLDNEMDIDATITCHTD